MTEFKNSKTALQYTNDPLQNFLYALKAPDSKRQYPRRFEYFLDYLGLQGTLKEKCIIFYEQAKNETLWTQHQIMQYVEFQKEREVYKKQVLYQTDERGIPISVNKKGSQPPSWPYLKKTEEYRYEAWLSKVSNPLTGEFYPQRDENGNAIKQPNGKPNANYVCTSIIRIKSNKGGKEFLYSQGTLQGFDGLGQLVTCACNAPEKWTRTLFATERVFDNRTKATYTLCKGVAGLETIYDLEFTPENLDKLYYGHAAGVNGNRILRTSLFGGNNNYCNLYVKDELTGRAKVVEWSSIEESYKLLRDKSFNYLWEAQYIPSQVKAEIRARYNDNTPVTSSSISNTANTNATNVAEVYK